MTRSILLLILTITINLAQAQKHYLLTGTYTRDGSKGIYVYEFNSKTGEVKEVSTMEAVNPSYLAIPKDNAHVYAVNENGKGKGAVSAYSFDHGSGTLKFINSQPSNGDDPCYLSVDPSNRWVAVANYSGGNFSIYKIQDNGGLSPAVQTITHSGSGINKERQEKPHAHAAVFSYDKKHLAVVDLGIDKIMVYKFDADKEKPLDEKPTEVKLKPGSGPRHLVFHPTRPLAYVVDELSGDVNAFHYVDGKFTWLQTISTHPKGFTGGKGSAEIRISPDGKFLYASNREESNTIATFAIGAKGMLKLNGIQPSGGIHPRDFNIDPSGKYVLVANMRSAGVTVFRRNSKTGLLEETGKKILIPNPVALVFTYIK